MTKIILLLSLILSCALVCAKPEGGDGFDPRTSSRSSENETRKNAGYSELNKMGSRPTMMDVLKAFDYKLPEIDPINIKQGNWTTLVLTDFADAIAKMEMLYPGAIWASLGRDAVQITDLLESFYLSYGQSNRTTRINASGPTFSTPALTKDYSLIVRMLKDAGMEIENPAMRPFVVLDRTSYSNDSQSTQLMASVYEYFTRTTGKPAQALFEKVAVLSSQSGMRATKRNEFFRELFTHSANESYPKLIAQIPELKGFTDLSAWHGSFGQLIPYPDGKVGGALGAPEALHVRYAALDLMISGYHLVTSQQFKDRVRAKAKALGYDFDEHMKKYGERWAPEHASFQVPLYVNASIKVQNFFQRLFSEVPSARFLSVFVTNHYIQQVMLRLEAVVSKEAINAEEEKSEKLEALVEKTVSDLERTLRAELAKYEMGGSAIEVLWLSYLATFTEVDMSYEGKSYLSANAKKIKESFHTIMEPGYQANLNYLFLKTLEYAHSSNIISSKDYRRLVLNSFNLVPKDQLKNFVSVMPSLLRASPKLKDVLVRKAEMFITSHRNNFGAQKIYMKLVENEMIPRPNDCNELLLKAEEKSKQNNKNPKHPIVAR